MKFIRAMKIVMRRRKRVDLTYPLIGAHLYFHGFLESLNLLVVRFNDFSVKQKSGDCLLLGIEL